MDICGIIQILQTSHKSMVVLVSLKSKLEYNINGLVIDAVLSTYLSPYLSVAEAQRGEMYWMAAAVEIDSTVFAKIFSQYFQLNFCKYFQLKICCWNWGNTVRKNICKTFNVSNKVFENFIFEKQILNVSIYIFCKYFPMFSIKYLLLKFSSTLRVIISIFFVLCSSHFYKY